VTFALAAAGCGEKDEPELAELPAPPTTTTTTPVEPPGPGGPAPRLAREAERTVETYVAWIDGRRGRQLCALLTPEAIEELKLPVRRGGCARSLAASIGYRNPRGVPVFENAELREARAQVRGRRARVVATVSIGFADREQASIEDDVVYLERRGGHWLVAKPSATLYRAIGAEIPASALRPPR
jgi:hypothetical protein